MKNILKRVLNNNNNNNNTVDLMNNIINLLIITIQNLYMFNLDKANSIYLVSILFNTIYLDPILFNLDKANIFSFNISNLICKYLFILFINIYLY